MDLIILHGAIGSKTQFQALIGKLEKQFRIHNLNFYGHGGLPITKPYRIEDFSEQLKSYIQEKQLQKPLLFGYSMGGMVALDLASKNSEILGSILTLGTKFRWSPEIAQHEIKMLNPDKIQEKLPKFAQILEKRHFPADWKQVLEYTKNMMLHLGDHNPINSETWAHIPNHVEICLGEQDEMVSQDETIEIHKLLPNSNFNTIPNSKHPIEQVDLDDLVGRIFRLLDF